MLGVLLAGFKSEAQSSLLTVIFLRLASLSKVVDPRFAFPWRSSTLQGL